MAHSNKRFNQIIQWAKKHLKCQITETKAGLMVTPPKKDIRPWTCHPDDKGMYDLMRYLAKVAGVSKRDIENAVRDNTKINT